jgi:acetyl-CoA carboxylase beta subunit/acetyl-CoA carboxylase alpha subunit
VTPQVAAPSSVTTMADLLDPDSFVSWDHAPVTAGFTQNYLTALRAAAERSGTDEAVTTGEGLIEGRRVALIYSEFAFLGGSIGSVAADRIIAAIERATTQRLPLIASTATGGTRMQEGTAAFLRMVPITAAITRHKAAGLLYLVHLRHPTTGGVFASWASLGHVSVAEPGALIGFLGPKVYSALHGTAFPRGVQTAEALSAHGLVDAVVLTRQLASWTARLLSLVDTTPTPVAIPADKPLPSGPEPTAWEAVLRSRRPERPGVRELLRTSAETVTLGGSEDNALVLALARFGGVPCVLAGQDRRAAQPVGPRDLRLARRGMRLAEQLRLPFVTVIDTAGAALSPAAEHDGLAHEIALCLAELPALPVATLAVLLGQGAGGAALALLPADRVLAARNSWLAPLPPEGAAAIQYGDSARAADAATAQGIRSTDLFRDGTVHRIIDERPDAAEEPEDFVRRTAAAIGTELRSATTSS